MADKLDDRLRSSELTEVVGALHRATSARRRWTFLALVAVGVALVALGLSMFGRTDGEMSALLIVPVLAVTGTLVVGLKLYRRFKSELAKLTFTEGLCELLADDFDPAGKVAIDLRLGGHDQERNRYWSGRSQHGNPKHKYADRWLVLRFRLADGSRVRLVRKADVKTKKGNVQRHKRQLYAHITPNPARYGPGPWDTSVLDGLVETAVARQFHDPPEGLRVRAGGGATIDLKITQLDAEILPTEVAALLDATLSAVSLHRLGP